jgi:hypothetical protein
MGWALWSKMTSDAVIVICFSLSYSRQTIEKQITVPHVPRMRKLTAHQFGCTVAPGEGKLHLSSTITWRMRPRVIQDTTATHAPVLDLASNVTRPSPPNRPSFPKLQAPATAMQAQITVTLSHVAGLREQNTWACASLPSRMMPTSDARWPVYTISRTPS